MLGCLGRIIREIIGSCNASPLNTWTWYIFSMKSLADNALKSSQVMWMRRLRVLRRLLVKYRASGKIDKHLYHELYHLSKGNTFKHKRALVEHVRHCIIVAQLTPTDPLPSRSTKQRRRSNVNVF